MLKTPKDRRKIIIGLIVSGASLAIIFYLTDFAKFIDALRGANYFFIALVFIITLLWLSVRGIVWRTLLQEKASYSQVFLTINEGYLLNNFLPFRLGEIARAFLLGRKAHLEFMRVFSTILIERAMDLALAVGLLLCALPFVIDANWAIQATIGALGLVVLSFTLLYLLARYRNWVSMQLDRIFDRWSIQNAIVQVQIPAFFVGLSVLTDGKRFLRAILWMTLNWGVAILQFYTLLQAFFPGSSLLWAVFSLGVIALGIAAPSSPGSVGVLELSMVAALSVFGLEASASLAAALTAHLANYIITGVIGIFALTRDGLTLTGLYKDVRSISPNPNA